MKIKVSSSHCKKILFNSLFTILVFLYHDVFFTTPKEICWETPKTFKFLGDHGSTHNQKFFDDLLISLEGHGCAKKVRYLPENLRIEASLLPGSDHESFSKHVK